jgi:hypothetical protein
MHMFNLEFAYPRIQYCGRVPSIGCYLERRAVHSLFTGYSGAAYGSDDAVYWGQCSMLRGS